MVLNKAYIISWMGRRDIAPARLHLLEQSVDWCRSKSLEPIIIAMEWESADFVNFSGVTTIQVPLRLPPAHARNIALNLFYASDDDYTVLLDDDTWIEKGDDIIDTIRDLSHPGLDLLSVLDQGEESVHFKESKNHHLTPMSRIVSGVFIFKNLRKYEKGELFFNTGFITVKGDRHDLMYGEDVNIVHRALVRGLDIHMIKSSMTNASRSKRKHPSTWMGGIEWADMEPYGTKNSYVGQMAYKEFGTIPSPIGQPFILRKPE